MAERLEVVSPAGEVASGGPGMALARLARLEGAFNEATPRPSVWPALVAAVGGAIVGAIAGYAAGGLVCRMKKVAGL